MSIRMARPILRLSALLMIAVAIIPIKIVAAAETEYDQLVAQAKKDAKSVDFLRLRDAYTNSPAYDPYSIGVAGAVQEMKRAVSRGDCPATLKATQDISEKSFVYIDAHLIAAHCHDQLKQPEAAQREREIGQKLARSVMSTGDGKSPETAFDVITLAEEYTVIAAMRMQKVKQSLIGGDGHMYDKLDVIPMVIPGIPKQDGAPAPQMTSVYFKVDRIFSKMGKELMGGPALEKPAAEKPAADKPEPDVRTGARVKF